MAAPESSPMEQGGGPGLTSSQNEVARDPNSFTIDARPDRQGEFTREFQVVEAEEDGEDAADGQFKEP